MSFSKKVNKTKIILGDGLLGSELRKQTGWDYISRKKDGFDFDNFDSYVGKIYSYGTIINCIANTDTYSPDLPSMWKTNYLAVIKLADYCNERGIKLVHISTDYIYAFSVQNAKETDVPVSANNAYSYTKLLSDAYVQNIRDYLIIRTSFKPRPFPYAGAFVSQRGNFDYVDVIAALIVRLIEKNAKGVYNVGTESKTMYNLAIQTMPNVEPFFEVSEKSMPNDVSMNVEKMEKFLGL